MGKLISINQSAFVPRKAIQDNITLANECFHALKLNRSQLKVGMALKLDLNKAYNSLEWNFLIEIMTKMGFTEKWLRLFFNALVRCPSISLLMELRHALYSQAGVFGRVTLFPRTYFY